MERRFRRRLDELLDDAYVPPSVLQGVLPRLETFLRPFVDCLGTPERQTHARHYVQGLVSDLKGKDVESIAYLHDCERQGLQKFIGQASWDHQPLLFELTRQVAAELGEADGVLVFDPSGFAKKGTESVGVQRQWCGRLGKVDNCQVGIYLAYVSRLEQAFVDFRLYLPKEWTQRRQRCRKAGVPDAVGFRTRHELILDMLDERGPVLPHAWISGDDELGRCSWFRQELRERRESYLLAVPSNTTVRDLTAPAPAPAAVGQGRRPKAPFTRVDRWCADLPESAWETVDVRDGEKGPLVVEGVRVLVQARTEGRVSDVVEQLVVFRERQADGTWKHDYLLTNAPPSTTLTEYARVFKAQHRVEECFQRAKGEAGLADYQVRTWEGWHHHQTLSLLATWYLTQETRRGKKTDAGFDSASSAVDDRRSVEWAAGPLWFGADSPYDEPPLATDRSSAALSLASAQPRATTSV